MNKKDLLDLLLPLPEPRVRKGRLVTNNPFHRPCAPAGYLGITEQRDYDDNSLSDRIRERMDRTFESKAQESERQLWENDCEVYWFRSAQENRTLYDAHLENIRNRRHMPRFYQWRFYVEPHES